MITAERIVAMALSGAAYVAAIGSLPAAEHSAAQTTKPLMAVSLDAGTKHVVSYFLSAEGVCKLTLMVAERDGDGADLVAPSRVQVSIQAGKSARFDTPEGKALLFACKPGAQEMRVAAVDRVAAYPDEEDD